MFRNNVVLALSLIVFVSSASTYAKEAAQACNFRNLIVIVDDYVENISEYGGSCMAHLISALADKSSPILVSTQVVLNYLERKRELDIHSRLEDSNEAKLVKFIRELQERIRSWGTIIETNHIDQAQKAVLITQAVNNELYGSSIESMQKEGKLPDKKTTEDIVVWLLRYDLIPVVLEDWQLYKVDDDFYLFVPKSYQQMCNEMSNQCSMQEGNGYSKEELALGLAVDHMELMSDPTDISLFYSCLCRTGK
jgi:hypothetical protein